MTLELDVSARVPGSWRPARLQSVPLGTRAGSGLFSLLTLGGWLPGSDAGVLWGARVCFTPSPADRSRCPSAFLALHSENASIHFPRKAAVIVFTVAQSVSVAQVKAACVGSRWLCKWLVSAESTSLTASGLWSAPEGLLKPMRGARVRETQRPGCGPAWPLPGQGAQTRRASPEPPCPPHRDVQKQAGALSTPGLAQGGAWKGWAAPSCFDRFLLPSWFLAVMPPIMKPEF